MNTAEYTIAEECTLPSMGKIYPIKVDPQIKLRSMTVEDEMRRLGQSDRPYKILCDLIDDCIVGECAISSYDMCLGDYQYLLHKLRIVTYGPNYKIISTCPFCDTQNEVTINLDELEIDTYTDEISDLFEVDLPVSKKKVVITYQTPRMLDEINIRKKEIMKKSISKTEDQSLLLDLSYLVKEIDGVKQNPITIEPIIRKWSSRDANKILKRADKINRSIGLKTNLHLDSCSLCSLGYDYPFRLNSEFFRPSED